MVEGYPIGNFGLDGRIVTLGRDVNRDGLLQNKEGKMEYRTNKRTGDRISVIGLGTSYTADRQDLH